MKLKTLSRSFTEEIADTKFLYVCLAFFLAVALPSLWAAIDWNSYFWDRYKNDTASFSTYLLYLKKRFATIYIVASALSLVIGAPLFYILRRRLPFKLTVVCLIAALIAILPNVLIEIFVTIDMAFDTNSSGSYTVGNCTIIDGNKRTLCGWKHFFLENILMVAFKGALAGAVFWLVMIYKNIKRRPDDVRTTI